MINCLLFSHAENLVVSLNENVLLTVSPGRETKLEGGLQESVLSSSSVQMVLSMGFSYLQVIEAYRIFGDDVDSMVYFLLDTSSSSRRKGKATE
jgi:OTU domain-containing protein 5